MGDNRDGYIDCLWRKVILIEMKSRGKSLKRAYQQATDYAFNLNDDELPEYIMVCRKTLQPYDKPKLDI